LAVLFAILPAAASAWDGWGWGAGFGPFAASFYDSGTVPTPPYFAIHPPVYYGKRVPMVYGNSPFPRLPQTAGEMIVNQYVVAPAGTVERVASAPGQFIVNRFVTDQPAARPSSKPAAVPAAKP
jgi:hypothetical protein